MGTDEPQRGQKVGGVRNEGSSGEEGEADKLLQGDKGQTPSVRFHRQICHICSGYMIHNPSNDWLLCNCGFRKAAK